MKYYIIAGEPSGDLHGANLIKELKRIDSEANFRIVGGDKMEGASSLEPFIHNREMAFMGFIEVIKNLKTISKNLKAVKNDILNYKPDCIILIDFPGFNLKIAEFAKARQIKVHYYISPKIWAWNTKRVHKIKKVVDHMYCILPFEVEFYKKYGMEVDYVGNPLLDSITQYNFNENFRQDNALSNRPLLAIVPGSRKMELEKILPELIKLFYLFPGHELVVAGAPNFNEEYYKEYIGDLPIKVLFNQTYDLIKNADIAAVTSGTATLEVAILNTPQVVVYKANAISVWLARKLVKIKFISLVNLINGFLTVKELIQQECNYRDIADELGELTVNSTYRSTMLNNYDSLREKLGNTGASQRTAEKIYQYTLKK
ncbi:MAG TPA: lipid-A-disaccharide synthase [Candidatus Sphingobacterium stercoripullorum]|uniref:Lipid-A-disaccharide synthase n=1 Tax=Candidatus Sphingobacterium stercoripullorum TaxID=2838759 RepID=A0A9D1W7H4_9SPHI|nr:lipid-A-disaccharide synthase [Candidatus Sphingobacterium stercoripullorum]